MLAMAAQQQLLAQFEEGKKDVTVGHIDSTNIVNGAVNTVTYAATADEASKQIQNIISLKIDEQSGILPLSNFSIIVYFTVESILIGGTTTSQSASLLVNYDTTTGAKYNVRSYIVVPSATQVKVTISSVSVTSTGSWNPLRMLRLENEMRTVRYYTMSLTSADLTPSFVAIPTLPSVIDSLPVAWAWNQGSQSTGNNMSQLEWAWVETEMAGFYAQNGGISAVFNGNSTRVDLDYGQNGFNIPLLYPGPGKLYYRVRPALRKNNGNVITGPWSAIDSFAFAGHEVNLNWQSSTSFAENGKYKTVIQYFDGSLRGRQTVTKDNEMGNAIVAETIYDLQGRPSVQILPTPTIDNTIRYFTDFNRVSGQLSASDDPARFFDLTPADVQCNPAPPLDITKGNGRYYSANNDWKSTENKSAYVPDANGYAYSETRYMDDGTGRVRSQGGVGITHQIGSGHETKYYYGKPNQQELDALFGTEVGDASHYSKNMVHDANGQMSVSYTDMHGRTIATALAGTAPANMVSIVNSTDYPQASGYITNQLLTPATNIIKSNSIQSVSTILVPAPTQYHFNYTLDPAVLSQYSCTNLQICFDCKYDLEISIRSEDCNAAAPIVKKYSNLQLVSAAQACGGSMGFTGTDISTPTKTISFTDTLSAGSWVVSKTLTINDSMFAIRKDSALKVFLCKTQQNIYDSIYTVLTNTSGCNVPAGSSSACDSCNAHLGTYSQYKTNYLLAIGNPAGYDTSTIHAQYAQDSLACAETCGHSSSLSTLASLRSQLLSDMIPFSGQYAIDPQFDQITGLSTAFSPTGEQAKYNIFTGSPAVTGKTKTFYQHPVSETGATSNYYTPENTVDKSLLDDNGITVLPGLSMQDFAGRFQPSWANSLVYYHPEFSKLKFAETNLSSAYAWQDKVQFTDDYASAMASGYTTPVSNDPYFSNSDALVQHYKDTISGYISSYLPGGANTAAENPSIWQVANAMVLCAGVTDANKKSCMLATSKTGLDAQITATADKNKVWQGFKGTYLSYRNDMLVKYINAQSGVLTAGSMASLQADGKQMAFTTSQDMANQAGAGNWWSVAVTATVADTARLHDSANAYGSRNQLNGDQCTAQRPVWAAMLMKCEQLTAFLNANQHADSVKVNTIINSILDGMVSVCHNSQSTLQPYGASTINPATGATPASFEAVVNQVFHENGIDTSNTHNNYFCNPFSVEAPKPYGKNAPLFVNYTRTVDSCNCSRFATLKLEAAGLGFSTQSQASMNQFLLANYHDTLTLPLWQALQNCSLIYTDTCNHSTLLRNRAFPNSLASSQKITSITIIPRLEFSEANTCLLYTPITLSSPVAMPAFLSCGYQRPCISCTQLSLLTTEFDTLYPWFAGVPFTSDTATDAQTQKNSLWARFLNYRTGFSLNALDYMAAYQHCSTDTSTAFIGNGNDCGTNTAVDSLLVNDRTGNAAVYYARETIVFQGSFTTNNADELTTSLDTALAACGVTYGIAGTALGSGSNYGLCAFDKPLNDLSVWEPVDTLPCRQVQTQALFMAQLMFEKIKDSVSARFDSLYMAKCLGAQSIEQFYANYIPLEYHYTLYYYDQAGNLVKTLPPAAVKPNYDATYLATVVTSRNAVQDQAASNNELLATHYRYNTLNQVIAQKTPDAGISKFWYDRLGRLAISQNAKQQLQSNYSYTLYDVLGRITEVGQRPQTTAMTQTISQDTTALKTWVANNSAGDKTDITATVYDQANSGIAVNTTDGTVLFQQNLRNRVSYTMVFGTGSQMQYLQSDGSLVGGTNATYYSYDIPGNVDTLLQDYKNTLLATHLNRFKKIVYSYDLISGKVNDVAYQLGSLKGDQFYHHYNYDAENRLTSVQTSKDKISWETDATYDYYRHGPLARTVLGQNHVQGLDYAYTLQGWLKGVNSSYVSPDADMGKDGQTTITGNPNSSVARDAYAFSLHYFDAIGGSDRYFFSLGDYVSVGGNNIFASSYDVSPYAPDTAFHSLYNGNINAITLDIARLNHPMAYNYKYDQLNRLVSMNAYKQDKVYGHWLSPDLLTTDYHEAITYDPNGNISSYLRNGDSAQNAMDNLTYQYERNSSGQRMSNKLRYIHDEVASANYASDIDNQTSNTLAQVQAENSAAVSSDNYRYDAIGNLVKDSVAHITNIIWNVYGKITQIFTNNGTTIVYTYDARGNRISKSVSTSGSSVLTYYVRDAGGNVLSVYSITGNLTSPSVRQSEIHLYGSSRLAVYHTSVNVESTPSGNTIFARGNKFFELSNHLGNVLATVSDKKLPHSSDGSSVDYYNPDIVNFTDYYPFGMEMPDRNYRQANSSYRYGFNGQEKSDEIKGEGNSYTAEFWEYDPRLGRRWNIDPITKEYESPYAAFSNNPIWFVDASGADTSKYLSNSQAVDAINIAYGVVKSHLDAKNFSIGNDYRGEVNKAVISYIEKNKLDFGAAAEFQQQAIDYYKGFKEVAESVNGNREFNELGSKILNNSNNSLFVKISVTQKLINQKNGQAGSVAFSGGEAFAIVMGAASTNVGPGPKGPYSSNTQELIVNARIPKVSFGGQKVAIFRGVNGDNALFQLKGGEYKFTNQTVRGLSVHVDAPKLTNARGASYQITQMPKELRIVQQGKDPGHFEIIPNSQITQERFQQLLNEIKYTRTQ